MLERLRHNRRLTLWVLLGFALVLAVALLSGAQTRKALPMADHCTTVQDVASTSGHGEHHAAPEPMAHQGHEGDPACVLCLALSTPPDLPTWAYRPPSAHAGRLWWAPDVPRAVPNTAPPPPLRGPPDQRTA